MKRVLSLLLLAIVSIGAAAQTSIYRQNLAEETTTSQPDYIIHVKTNGIGWLMAVANASVEFDMSRRFSMNFPVYVSAWDYFKSTIKFRTFTIQPEVRYWFADGHEGWFVGAHLGLGFFNYAMGKGHYRIQDRNWNTPAIGGGVAAGYRMPVSADKRWEMEFSLGAGVYNAYYDKWENRYHGHRVARGLHKVYFGLDQASVSVCYKFYK